VAHTWPDTGSGEILGGRYQLVELVGSGGMATVHRAHDLVLDRDVAVKVFRTDVSEATDYRRIQAEVKILGSVNHPNLVTLHDASLSDDHETAFLVMELVDGEDLGHLLAEHRITARDAVRISGQIAGALAHIHRKGIVHRDVKPANILVRRDQDGRVWAKLADLGIARIADATHLTAAGTMLGTVGYLSPEQVSGGYIDAASDVYALGLVLIECLTGVKPFPGTPQESAAMRTVRSPDLPAGLPEAHAAVLRAMTALDPAARISAAQAEDALSRWEAMTGVATNGAPIVSGPITEPYWAGAATGANGVTQPMTDPYAATALQHPATAPQHPTTGGAYPATGGAYPVTGPQYGGPQDVTQRLGAPFPTTDSTARFGIGPATGPSDRTMPLATGPTTATGSTRVSARDARRGRVIAIVMWVLVAALLVAAAFVAPMVISKLNPDAVGGAGAGQPSYPPVSGELENELKDLQESVQ
jgi:tRNA A-37 threonylcarbamoyl transferase component Bud32